jgi:hypothetical protein
MYDYVLKHTYIGVFVKKNILKIYLDLNYREIKAKNVQLDILPGLHPAVSWRNENLQIFLPLIQANLAWLGPPPPPRENANPANFLVHVTRDFAAFCKETSLYHPPPPPGNAALLVSLSLLPGKLQT